MKRKLLIKASFVIAALILVSGGLITSFAETSEGSGCPEDTGGYASKGIRMKKECKQTVSEYGYWWYFKGEVKWVGTVIGGVGGRFEKSVRNITYTGIEYSCVGIDKVCWVCNCYFINPTATIENTGS